MAAGRQLTERGFKRSARELIGSDPALGAIVERHGLPEFWARQPGFATLLLLILEQQVSLASARAAYDRVDARVGGVTPGRAARAVRRGAPRGRVQPPEDALRARSRRRDPRARAGAGAASRLLDDDEVRAALIALPGIGPWTAEVYLLSALRRPDTWPVGDIALQEATRRALGLEARPSALELEAIGERWRPHRATAARLLWHLYLSEPRVR